MLHYKKLLGSEQFSRHVQECVGPSDTEVTRLAVPTEHFDVTNQYCPQPTLPAQAVFSGTNLIGMDLMPFTK